MNSRERAEKIVTTFRGKTFHDHLEPWAWLKAHIKKAIDAHAEEARNAAIEEAAKVLEEYSNSCSDHDCCCGKDESLIRALKKPEGGER